MPKYQELNQALNRSLRAVDEACLLIVDVKSQTYESDINSAVKAVSLLANIQENLYKLAPECSWHYEKNKPDTPFMSTIRKLFKDAHALELKGNIKGSIKILLGALQLEPPPIQYEEIKKELLRLRSYGVVS